MILVEDSTRIQGIGHGFFKKIIPLIFYDLLDNTKVRFWGLLSKIFNKLK
jgi:hypothetical protein